MTNGLILSLFIAVVAALGTSPAGGAGLTEEDRNTISRLLGEGVLGPALPPDRIGEKATLVPLAAATRIFRLSDGPDAGNTETDILKASMDASSDSTWQYAAGGRCVYNLRPATDGSIVIPSQQDMLLGVLIRYNPPEPLIIPGLQPGDHRTLSVAVEISNLDDLGTVAHSGSVLVDYTYIGRYRVTVPAGTYSAALIKWQYHGDVGPTGFKGAEYWFFAEGVGPIAVIGQRHMSTLVVYNKDEKYAKVLQSIVH